LSKIQTRRSFLPYSLEKLDKLGAWIRSRSRIDYAIILAAIGVLFIGLGWTHL
jgi:hypothetical protein